MTGHHCHHHLQVQATQGGLCLHSLDNSVLMEMAGIETNCLDSVVLDVLMKEGWKQSNVVLDDLVADGLGERLKEK